MPRRLPRHDGCAGPRLRDPPTRGRPAGRARAQLQYPTDFSRGLTKLSATHTLAHEYGHHVQQLSGIFPAIASHYRGQTERRSKLQASCLGNVFLSSQRDAYPVAPDYLQYPECWRFITRVPNHGSVANQQLWTGRGYDQAKPGACNTFKVGGRKVA